jgi:uncharacterized membrane protein
MYTLIKAISTRQILTEQIPSLAVSILIAEVFYKFHSFTLECLAFLVTWYIVNLLIEVALQFFPLKSSRRSK